MAKGPLKDAYVRINDVVLSEYVSEVSIETQFDEIDVSGMGGDYKEIVRGLGDATITMTLFQDFDAAAVHATLQPLAISDATFEVYVKKSTDAVGATNPAFVMTSRLYNYNPLSGSPGAALSTPLTFRNASTDGLVVSDTAT